MALSNTMEDVVACGTCGLVQRVKPLRAGMRAQCARCGFALFRRKVHSRMFTAALALGALILYFPANLYPITTTYYWGMHKETTIFDGIRALYSKGNYVVGSLVFTTSILTPALKILGLLFLSLTLHSRRWKKFRTWTYKIIQFIDPWNMLEVTLLAILVSVAELGKVATVLPGAGVFSFGGVVILTISATITFDPRLVWDEPEVKRRE
jgi:paraquat-inducible protein A